MIPMTRDDIKKIMDKNQELNDFGFGYYFEVKRMPSDEMNKWFEKNRQRLLDKDKECTSICEWLLNIQKRKTIDKSVTSYSLKHIAEKEIGYITNGAFICAAIHMGFNFKIISPNAYFNMSWKSIKESNGYRKHYGY